jgi:hypothetical protein
MSESSWETLKRVLDLAGALQLTVGAALSIAAELVAGFSTTHWFLTFVAVPLTAAVGIAVSDRAPSTTLLWFVGLAVVGAALGLSVLAYALDISVSGTATYLAAAALVAVVYALHRGFKALARSTLPEPN